MNKAHVRLSDCHRTTDGVAEPSRQSPFSGLCVTLLQSWNAPVADLSSGALEQGHKTSLRSGDDQEF